MCRHHNQNDSREIFQASISGAVSTVGIVAGEAICGSQPTTTTTQRPTTSTAAQNDCFDYNTDIDGAILNGENQNHFQTAEKCQACCSRAATF